VVATEPMLHYGMKSAATRCGCCSFPYMCSHNDDSM